MKNRFWGIVIIILGAMSVLSSCHKDKPPVCTEYAVDTASACYDFPPEPPFGYVSYGPEYQYSRPCYNPNNDNQIVFVKYKTESVNNAQLIVMDLCSGEQRSIYSGAVWFQPKWSVKDWIAFTSNDGQIWKVKSDGSGLQRLTNGGGSFGVEWNPQGTLLVMYTYDSTTNIQFVDESGQIVSVLENQVYNSTCHWDKSNKIYMCGSGHVGYIDLLAVDSPYILLKTFPPPNTATPHYLTKSNSVILSVDRGYKQVFLPSVTVQDFRPSCRNKTYIYYSVSSDESKIIAERVDSRLTSQDSIYEAYTIVMMNSDGSDERIIIRGEK